MNIFFKNKKYSQIVYNIRLVRNLAKNYTLTMPLIFFSHHANWIWRFCSCHFDIWHLSFAYSGHLLEDSLMFLKLIKICDFLKLRGNFRDIFLAKANYNREFMIIRKFLKKLKFCVIILLDIKWGVLIKRVVNNWN